MKLFDKVFVTVLTVVAIITVWYGIKGLVLLNSIDLTKVFPL